MAVPSFRSLSTRLMPRVKHQDGFTLIEVIVSSVVILIAMVGAIAAFNLVTQSVRGTGLRADQSRRIDAQVAEISRLSEIYTACLVPAGAVPANPDDADAACGPGSAAAGVQTGNSFYYFPDSANIANINAFFAACRSTTPGTHITANFIDAINALPAPGGEVNRQNAIRIEGADANNHAVQVTWSDQAGNELRTLRSSPLVSAWCP